MFEGLAKSTGEIKGESVCLRSPQNQYYWPELHELREANREWLEGNHLGPFEASLYNSPADMVRRLEANSPVAAERLYDEAFIMETGGQVIGEIAYLVNRQDPSIAKVMLWVGSEFADQPVAEQGVNALSSHLFDKGLVELCTRLPRTDGATRRLLEATGWHLYESQSHEPDYFNMSLTPDMFNRRHLQAAHRL